MKKVFEKLPLNPHTQISYVEREEQTHTLEQWFGRVKMTLFSPCIMLSRLLFPESVGVHRIYRKSHEKLGNVSMECYHRIPSTLIYSSIRNTHTYRRTRAGICKSCLKCITFGSIVCLGVAFRANFIPGKVEVAQLTSMQMVKEGVRHALLYIYRKWRSPRQNGNTMSSNVLVSRPDAWNYENDLRNME